MRRREFIGLVGGAAVPWSLAANAQQPATPVVGFMHARPEDGSAPLVAAFRRGLAENGYTEGQNLQVEYRWANGQYDRLPTLAADLLRVPVNMLVAGSEPAALAAKAATSTIPIVFVVGTDPVKLGVVSNFNKPGGNATGVHIFTAALQAKRLGLLHDLIPKAETIGVLLNPTFPYAADELAQIEAAATNLGPHVRILRASTPAEIDAAFDTLAGEHILALSVTADPYFDGRRDQLVTLAAVHAVPVMYQFRQYVSAGGLMSYGINLPDAYRQAGDYVGRILKGEKPAELPVLQPSRFEFIVNLKTAKSLGLTFPPGLLAIADEVIE